MKYGLLCGWVCVLALSACSKAPPYTEGRAERFTPPQIMFTGPDGDDLRNATLVDQPILARDGAELLRVTVPVRATANQVLHTQYRVTFYDNTGQPLPGSPTGWFRKDLEPGGRELIVFNSTSPRAADFQMEVRWAR